MDGAWQCPPSGDRLPLPVPPGTLRMRCPIPPVLGQHSGHRPVQEGFSWFSSPRHTRVCCSPQRFWVIRIRGESPTHLRSKMPQNSSKRVLQKPLTPNCKGCSKVLLFLMGLSPCRAWSGQSLSLWRAGSKGEERGACGRSGVHNPAIITLGSNHQQELKCSKSQITHWPLHHWARVTASPCSPGQGDIPEPWNHRVP